MATVDQIRDMREDFLKAEDVANCMKIKPDRFREYARNGQLPFPVRISGNRVLISRKSFLSCYGYKEAERNQNASMQEIAAELREIRQMLAEIIGRREAV